VTTSVTTKRHCDNFSGPMSQVKKFGHFENAVNILQIVVYCVIAIKKTHAVYS